MTAFLIAIILAIIISIVTGVSTKSKENKCKNSTRTNVELEKQVREEILKQLSPSIDIVVTNEESVYHYIDTLYDKYDIPKYYSLRDKDNSYYEKYKKASDECEELHQGVRLYDYRTVATISSVASSKKTKTDMSAEEKNQLYEIYFQKAPHFHTPVKFKDLLEGAKNTERKKYNEERNISAFRRAFGVDCPPFPTDPPQSLYYRNMTIRQRMYNLKIQDTDYTSTDDRNRHAVAYFERLVMLMTMREMHGRGYALSLDGRHESEWQEEENLLQKIKEEKDKYPWLYR